MPVRRGILSMANQEIQKQSNFLEPRRFIGNLSIKKNYKAVGMKHQTWPIFGLGILVAVLIVRLGDHGRRFENLIQSLQKSTGESGSIHLSNSVQPYRDGHTTYKHS